MPEGHEHPSLDLRAIPNGFRVDPTHWRLNQCRQGDHESTEWLISRLTPQLIPAAKTLLGNGQDSFRVEWVVGELVGKLLAGSPPFEGRTIRSEEELYRVALDGLLEYCKQGDLPAGEEPDHNQASKRLGRYRLLRTLGRGGQATVFEAEDPLHRPHTVALKVLEVGGSARPGRRLQREFRYLKMLEGNRFIPTPYEFGIEQGRPYLSTQYIAGKNLDAHVCSWRTYAPKPRRQIRQVLRWMRQTCKAVEFVHKKGLIHRDLKPKNLIWQDEAEQIVLVDFGLARGLDEGSLMGSRVGTLSCMAPEQLDVEGSLLDRRVDVYALGLLFYRLITLEEPQPFLDSDGVHRHLLPRLDNLPASFDPRIAQVIRTATESKRTHRYATVSQFRGELERIRE